MITFKAIIIPNNKRKDGTYPVKIRVTFGGKTRRLATNLVCKQEDLTRGNKIKSAFILNKAEETISQMRKAAADIPMFELEGKDVDWVVARIKSKLSSENFQLDFFEFADQKVLPKIAPGTRALYVTALNAFERFLGVRRCDINSITKSVVREFVSFRENENIKWHQRFTNTLEESKKSKKNGIIVSMNVARLAMIFNMAKQMYNDEDEDVLAIPRSPFANVEVPRPESSGQENLGVELMQRIIDATDVTRIQRMCFDAFLLSFCFMGANMADMYAAKAVKGDTWDYCRQKSRSRRRDKARMVVHVPEQARIYMNRLANKNGWMLGDLHDRHKDKNGTTSCVNRLLRKWCESNGVPVFTFYAARHTWASLARQLGIDKAIIDECLAHIGNYNLVDIYAPERNWEKMAEANAKVLALFRWPQE